MSQKTYYQISGLIFTVAALMHALRILMGWEVNLGGWSVPVWASLVGVAVAGYLAYTAYKLMK